MPINATALNAPVSVDEVTLTKSGAGVASIKSATGAANAASGVVVLNGSGKLPAGVLSSGDVANNLTSITDVARFQTTSTTYVDITNATITPTITAGSLVMITYNLNVLNTTASMAKTIISIGGSAETATEQVIYFPTTANDYSPFGMVYFKAGLSGATIIKLQAKTSAGTYDTGGDPYFLQCIEIKK